MNAKTIVCILVVIAIIVVAANLVLYTPAEQSNDSIFTNRIDSNQSDDTCRELIYDEDAQSWVESTSPLDSTVNECDEKFQECYAKTGNVYVELVECLNTP